MNFLSKHISKHIRNKIIAQALIGTSVFSLGVGYNFIVNKPVAVYASTSDVTIGNLTYSIDISTQEATVIDSIDVTGSITIPSSIDVKSTSYKVTKIGECAFYDNSLTSVTIPSSVTSIENSAFQTCLKLKSITIPSSVTYLGLRAFKGCASLKSVIFKGDLTMNSECFMCCRALTSITIPNTLKSIGSCAFAYCTSLKSITIPKTLTSVGKAAFANCTSLTSITIPKTVTSVGEAAFADCTGLKTIRFKNTSIIEQYIIDGCSSLTTLEADGYTFKINQSAKTATTSDSDCDYSVLMIGNVEYTLIIS